MKRIGDVKAEFSQIKQDVVELQKLQLDALNQVKSEFDKLLSSLSSLDNKVLQSQVSVISRIILFEAVLKTCQSGSTEIHSTSI